MFKKAVLLFFTMLISIVSCAPPHHAPAGLEGMTVSSHMKETWGYGCGRDCTFNSDGSDKTELIFEASGAAKMNNAGRYVNVIHYPHSFILDAKKWSYNYKGRWSITGDEIEIVLALAGSECSVQRSEGKKKMMLACEKPLPSRLLICRVDKKNISDVERDVLICRDEAGSEVVFGIDQPIVTVILGEPSVKTYFYTTKPF